jgi:hypothetical protein
MDTPRLIYGERHFRLTVIEGVVKMTDKGPLWKLSRVWGALALMVISKSVVAPGCVAHSRLLRRGLCGCRDAAQSVSGD